MAVYTTTSNAHSMDSRLIRLVVIGGLVAESDITALIDHAAWWC
jgi:hypothetical protein